MPKIGTRPQVPPEYQGDARLAQANPVQNTWYTVLDTTKDVLLFSWFVMIATTDETIEVRMTIDGKVLTGSLALTAGSSYYIYIDLRGNDSLLFSTTAAMAARNMALPARSIKLEVRKTTAAGAGTLYSRACYGRWP